jgi:hypothetical protein
MDRLLLDLRLAIRRLRQNLGFTAVAILTLALGIGANTATFSAINAILLRPLPVANPSEIVTINQTLGGNTFPSLSYPNYRDVPDTAVTCIGMIVCAPHVRVGETPIGRPLPKIFAPHWRVLVFLCVPHTAQMDIDQVFLPGPSRPGWTWPAKRRCASRNLTVYRLGLALLAEELFSL